MPLWNYVRKSWRWSKVVDTQQGDLNGTELVEVDKKNPFSVTQLSKPGLTGATNISFFKS